MKRRCRLKHAFAGKSLAIILAAVLAIPVPGLERASVAYAAEMAEATTETEGETAAEVSEEKGTEEVTETNTEATAEGQPEDC